MSKNLEQSQQTNQILTKLTADLMTDLDKIRDNKMTTTTATLICRHANTVMKAENVKLQYVRVTERVERIKR